MKLFTTTLLLFSSLMSIAQDSLSVKLDKKIIKPGDSFIIEAKLHNYDSYTKMVSLITSFTNIENGKTYTYNLPLMDGYVRPIVTIDSTIPYGHYAVNTVVHPEFLTLKGKIDNWKPSTKTMLAILKSDATKEMEYKPITPADDGSFNLGKMLIMNNASLSFLSANKKVNKKINVRLCNPLDSAFYPVDSLTNFIRVSNNPLTDKLDSALIKNYINNKNTILKLAVENEVIIKAKGLSAIDAFIKKYVSEAYSGKDAQIIDGLSNNDLANMVNLQNVIEFSAPGFNFEDGQNMYGEELKLLTYRGKSVIYAVDEIVEVGFPYYLSADDIALIKIFTRGLNSISTGTNGNNYPIVAIYRKRDSGGGNSKNRTSFKINGYKDYRFKWK